MRLSVRQKAITAICLVALSYTFLNVAVRFMNAGFGPFTQVYLRIALGFILTWMFFYKEIHPSKFLKISKKDWMLLFLIGTVGYGLAVDFITLAVLHTKLLNVSIISTTTPFFVFLFSVLFLRKAFRYTHLFYLVVSFYGIFVIATQSFFGSLASFGIGDLYALLFAIGVGVYVLGRKYLSHHLNNSEIAVIIMLIAFFSSFITALIVGEQLHTAGFFNPLALFGLLVGGVLVFVTTKLQNFGFEHLNAVVSSQLMLLQNVFAPILGFVLYHEIILPTDFFGALFVLIGVWTYIKQSPD